MWTLLIRTNKDRHFRNAKRTRLSTPQAQPTPTEAGRPESKGKKARQEAAAEEPESREPEKATQGKDRTKEAKETITKNKKMNANKQEHESSHQRQGRTIESLYTLAVWLQMLNFAFHFFVCMG